MPRDDWSDPWGKSGFQKRKPEAPKPHVEQVALSDDIKEVLLFLATPKALSDSVDLVRNPGLRMQLGDIQKQQPSVYTTKSGSEGDTQQRRDLKAALDEVSTAAKALLSATGNGKSIAKSELRRTHVFALQSALESVAACREAFEQSGAHDGQAASGHIWVKMFDGNTLEAAVINQAHTMLLTLQQLADKGKQLG